MGVRLRRLREEKQLTQQSLAATLGISASYLSQLEQNQRPLTVPLLLRLNAAFGVDVQTFSDDAEARLVTQLRDALADADGGGDAIALAEIRELATQMPAVAHHLISLHRRYRDSQERAEAMAAKFGADFVSDPPVRMPYEQVREYFYSRHNHISELDEAAEKIYAAADFKPHSIQIDLAAYLATRHGVRLVHDEGETAQRRYNPKDRTLHLSPGLRQGQQAFQMATQLAFLEVGDVIDQLTQGSAFVGDEARMLARIGLANYFAGALILPYHAFLQAAEAERYDIEKLERIFGVRFETICHRLSTLQCPDARGIPFFFIRVDRAGNISKRQSATDFHFSRVGGSCPLWSVYEAFAQPARVLTQIAQMPDGRTYLWIARTVGRESPGYGMPAKTLAVGLGCDIRHASRLVYARGLDISNPDAATPIGAGCRICERSACPQRAFPTLGRALAIDENRSVLNPYPGATPKMM